MRKFSAHRIHTVSGRPIPYGIIETEDDGTILRVRETGGKPVEEAGLEFYPGIIVPGFINAHLHLELSHMAGAIPRGTGLAGFVMGISGNRESDPARIVKAAKEADRIMYLQGISGAGDISNTDISLKVKQESSIRYHTFVELFGLNEDVAEARMAEGLRIAALFAQAGSPATLSPHAPYSLGSRMWNLLSGQKDLTRLISIHANESPEEIELLHEGQGPLADRFRQSGLDLWAIPEEAVDLNKLLDKYLPDSECLLVHNAVGAIPLTGNVRGVSYVFCVRSNRYISNLWPDPVRFSRAGHRVCLGTDSLASCESLSVLDEMKEIGEKWPELAFEELLEWATLNGAKALGFDAGLGSVEAGKKPGLVNIPVFDWKLDRLTAESRPVRLI
jgi:cytosine/adenosine deaminase-related metal-dependent hydrolase